VFRKVRQLDWTSTSAAKRTFSVNTSLSRCITGVTV
jgi:hypothetical protein